MTISRHTACSLSLAFTLIATVTSGPVEVDAQGTALTIALPAGDRFTSVGRHLVSLSPDGLRVVYAANDRLYLQSLSGGTPTAIAGVGGSDSARPSNPAFSPDGRWIAFWQARQLKKVPIDGGMPIVLCGAQNPQGISWGAANAIVYGQGTSGIWRVSASGGTPEQLAKVESGELAHGPQILPDGRSVLFTLARGSDPDATQVVVHAIESGMRRVVIDRAIDARYVPSSHIVYARGDALFSVPFDAGTLETTGTPVRVADGVAQGAAAVLQFAVDSDRLVYVPADAVEGRPARTLVWVDREGRETPIDAPPRNYFDPRLSPDGSRIAIEIDNDIWVFDLARSALTRLTDHPGFESVPVWTPDGRSVIFTAGPSGRSTVNPLNLWRRDADGQHPIEHLTDQATARQVPYAVTPDGARLVFREHPSNPGGDEGDLRVMSLAGDRQSQPLLATNVREMNGELSPDGRWLAYQSNESGRDEIYVRPFPGVTGGTWQVSSGGGVRPLWARAGGELFFESARSLMRVPISTTDGIFAAGVPGRLFDGPYFYNVLERMYDVSADGQRFLMIKEASAGGERALSPRFIVISDWREAHETGNGQELFKAIRASDRGAVARALALRASVNGRSMEGDTPLMYAAVYSISAVAQMLLDAGADPNARDKQGGTALMRAIRDRDMVRLLLDRGADIHARSIHGVTALMVAANRPGGSEVVKLLLARGADPRTPDAAGISPLMYATDFGDLESVKALVGGGADVKAGRPNGATPLFWAANGPPDVLAWLLEHGADPNATRGTASPLMEAARFGAVENVRALLDRGADVNARDERGTPLIHAVGSDRAGPDTIRLLLDRGADPNALARRCERCIHEPRAEDGSDGLTALMLARQRGESDIVKMLVAAGAAR
jgi:ankyrin repeat protein/Tol biopolymer transport system component